MKRPIKFRGRDIAGTMRFGHYVTYDDYPFIKQDGCYYEVYPDSVAQLVGYDFYDKEVYEGDTIVDADGYERIVEYGDNPDFVAVRKLKE